VLSRAHFQAAKVSALRVRKPPGDPSLRLIWPGAARRDTTEPGRGEGERERRVSRGGVNLHHGARAVASCNSAAEIAQMEVH